MNKGTKKKVKRHIKWKSVIAFLFVIATFSGSFYYITHLHIKNIYITGNTLLKDNDIILAANIKDYPKMTKYSIATLKKNIEKLDLVNSAVVKKNIFGKLTIQIDEASVLFYNRGNGSFVLSNGREVADGYYTGVPFLVNYVPDAIYERLIKEFSSIKKDSIALISEIEYSPSKSGEVVIDDTRFLLRMNDGNQVYINLINIDRLDMYTLLYSRFMDKGSGILTLDSDNGSVIFSQPEGE